MISNSYQNIDVASTLPTVVARKLLGGAIAPVAPMVPTPMLLMEA